MEDISLYSPGEKVISIKGADNIDIINTIEKSLPLAVSQTKNIASKFLGSDVLDTCKNIFDFLKDNIFYVRDQDEEQIIKLPSKLLADKSGDCKSFALFTAAILKNLNIPFVFRYINQTGGNIPAHVYTVAYNGSDPIYIDAVWYKFNEQPDNIKFLKDYNYNTMNVSAIAGVKTTPSQTDFIINKINGIYGYDFTELGGAAVIDAASGGTDFGLATASDLLTQTVKDPSNLLSLFGGGSSKDAGSGVKATQNSVGYNDWDFGNLTDSNTYSDVDDKNRKVAQFESYLKGWPAWNVSSLASFSQAIQDTAQIFGVSSDNYPKWISVLKQQNPGITKNQILDKLSHYFDWGRTKWAQDMATQTGLTPNLVSSPTPGAPGGGNTPVTPGGNNGGVNMNYVLIGGAVLAAVGLGIYFIKK